jgi:hypothetical protein
MSDLVAAFTKARLDLQSNTYYDTLDADGIKDEQLANTVKNKFTKLKYSHINRFTNNVQVMKYALSTSKTNMITTCFKVTFDSTSCIYANLHSRCRTKGKKTTITHEFICTGPTFRSQDGEYRNRFIRYDLFAQLFTKYGDVFAKVEEMVVEKLSSGKIELFADFYYPQSCSADTKYMNEFINTSRIAIRLYMLAWIRDFHYIHMKIPENHMNPAYQYIIYRPEDLSTYNDIMKSLNAENIEINDDTKYDKILGRITKFYINVDEPEVNVERLSCGQKIFPLTVIESIRTDDINYSVWREMYMTNLVSNLVLNLATPSFPFLGSWFYIQNSHAGLFDNVAMFEKYKHSDIASDISQQLRAIDQYNYYSRERQNGALSGKFLQLSKNINKSIVYADSDIRLTDLSVCVTSEWVGRTLRDIPNIIAQKKHLHGLDMIFTSPDTFAKHMFEYVYAFYCMNTRLGIIHGDLHMNNVTIFRLYTMVDAKGIPLIKNPVVMYILAEGEMFGGMESSAYQNPADGTDDDTDSDDHTGSADSTTDSADKRTAKRNENTDSTTNSADKIGAAANTDSTTDSTTDKTGGARSKPTSQSAQKPPVHSAQKPAHPERKIGPTSYVFPHNGLFSMVIDMSRAVLGDVRRLENEFGPLYAEAYFRDQQNRLLHIINNNFPEIIESSRSAVTRLVMENFPLMFKILSCVDVFTVMSNIKSMFSIDDIFTQGKIKLATGISSRLERLITLSTQLFSTNMNSAIRGDITVPDDIEWPCAVIIREVFADFATRDIRDEQNLVDVFRSDSEMKYDISDYDSWGPLVSLEPYWKLWRETIGKEHEEVGKLNEFLKDFSEAVEMHKIVLPYMKQEEEVLEFEPWMMM